MSSEPTKLHHDTGLSGFSPSCRVIDRDNAKDKTQGACMVQGVRLRWEGRTEDARLADDGLLEETWSPRLKLESVEHILNVGTSDRVEEITDCCDPYMWPKSNGVDIPAKANILAISYYTQGTHPLSRSAGPLLAARAIASVDDHPSWGQPWELDPGPPAQIIGPVPRPWTFSPAAAITALALRLWQAMFPSPRPGKTGLRKTRSNTNGASRHCVVEPSGKVRYAPFFLVIILVSRVGGSFTDPHVPSAASLSSCPRLPFGWCRASHPPFDELSALRKSLEDHERTMAKSAAKAQSGNFAALERPKPGLQPAQGGSSSQHLVLTASLLAPSSCCSAGPAQPSQAPEACGHASAGPPWKSAFYSSRFFFSVFEFPRVAGSEETRARPVDQAVPVTGLDRISQRPAVTGPFSSPPFPSLVSHTPLPSSLGLRAVTLADAFETFGNLAFNGQGGRRPPSLSLLSPDATVSDPGHALARHSL
ncbi:hypothetical protein G7046_g6185 [Stylonectria norvegica]|nr:hypothetical protein G7046_g6185 [Stylonectria norvegica]